MNTVSIDQADQVVHNLATMLAQAQVARSKIRQSFVSPVRLVTINKFCEATGYTKAAVNSKIDNGVWLEGTVWKKSPDGKRMIDLQEYDRWAIGELKRA